MTEEKPSSSGWSGRSPSPSGSGCRFPSLSNETSLNSGGARVVLVRLVARPTGVATAARLNLCFSKKNLRLIRDQYWAYCSYLFQNT